MTGTKQGNTYYDIWRSEKTKKYEELFEEKTAFSKLRDVNKKPNTVFSKLKRIRNGV